MNFGNVSDVVCNIGYKATEFYFVLRHKDVSLTVLPRTIFSDPRKAKLNDIDKCCLSLLFASLIVDSDAKKLMNRFGVTIDNVLEFLELDSTELLCLEEISESEKDRIYTDDIKTIIEMIAKDLVYLDSESLVDRLMMYTSCGSRVVQEVLDGVAEKYAPLSGDSLSYWLSKNASDKVKTYLELHPEKKQKTGKGKKEPESPISQLFSSLLGGSPSQETNQCGIYLTDNHYDYNPVVGREEEMKKLIISLLTPEESPILLGPPGVGKSVLVEGLAYLIQQNMVPDSLKGKKILMINTVELVSGTRYRGEFEERINNIISEVENKKDIILFIDELHTAIGAGASSQSNLDLVNILKPYLSSGRIKMIGATTSAEFEQYVAADGAFSRRFGRVDIKEPDKKELLKIMDGSILKYKDALEVDFSYKDDEKDKILNIIMDVTNSRSRIYTDKGVNPDLALSILKKSFVFAKYNNHDEVTIGDIADSIMSCERIYKSARERKVAALLTVLDSLNTKEKEYKKIIEFGSYKKS